VNRIDAIIKPEKLESVITALTDAGFEGMTMSRCSGRGDNLGTAKKGGAGTTFIDYTASKIKLEVVVRDEDTRKVIDLIRGTVNTGTPGDGRIFVTPVIMAVRIDTGEFDAASL
jgi:nitrogen regulatory protein PII